MSEVKVIDAKAIKSKAVKVDEPVKSKPTLKVKRLSDKAVLPIYATDGAGAFDLHAVIESVDGMGINLSNPRVIGTGLAFEVPEGHVMLVFGRSGQAYKHDVRLANCVGVIDSDYRGEVKVKLTRDPSREGENYHVYNGDRIAQAMVIRAEQFEIVEAEELSATVRGEGGFGSTGKQ